MALSLTDLQSLRDELEKALYSGALEVRFGDRWIKYQTTDDMRKALADLNNKITATSSGSTTNPSRTTYAGFSKQ